MAVKTKVVLRPATAEDLLFINGIVEAAVMSWALPERVKRLSMPSYRYEKSVFESVDMQLAIDPDGDIVGLVASCAPMEEQVLPDRKALLLHGIFVDATNHREGIGTELVKSVQALAAQNEYEGVLVNAQPDALAFFQALGFEQLPVVDEENDYKHRYWQAIS
ncbi:MAG: GNAT family N-acetyltransferase [Granulosicoccaceae bacterium]